MLSFPRSLCAFAALLCCSTPLVAEPTSPLWGERGESWAQNGRLPDFSWAGYHSGFDPVPNVRVTTSVKDHGAVGDGEHDDTAAFNAAIAATTHGAILVPPGRYKITDYVRIEKPGVVLRGSGTDKTVLWFPLGLDEIHPREMRESRGLRTSGYSFDGAFVTVQGSYRAQRLAGIAATAKRGDYHVLVDRTEHLRAGQPVLIHVREDDAHTLKTHLYSDDPGDISRGKSLDTKMAVRIAAIEGRRVTLNRPLRFDVRPEWQPEIRAFRPSVDEVGIENMTFEFPNRKYGGHFNENGANAIELREVANCWVRNVRIHNGDLGINIVAALNTIDGIVFTADRERETTESGVPDCTGHHAIQCKSAEDNLIMRFDLRTCYVHDLTVEHASGNVFTNGAGRDLCFDHHKDSPYENLFTAIDCGRGTRVWLCGGGAGLGRQSAGHGTFWNIRADKTIPPPPAGWGPKTLTFVGVSSQRPDDDAIDAYWEPVELVEPHSLHAAQLKKRLGGR